MTAALGLLDNGFDVTVYSDRDQPSLRDDVPPTGTALIFGHAQRAEESLGLNTYLATAPTSTGQSVRVVDDRLTRFQQRGGRFVVEAVDLDGPDRIAAGVDLTLVATGRNGLSSLFPVVPARTAYDNLFFAAADTSPRFASRLFGLLDDPRPFEAVTSVDTAKRLITEFAGEPVDTLLDRFLPAGSFERSRFESRLAQGAA